VRTIRELVTFARARPGQLIYASAGNTSTTNLYMALFNSMVGVKMLHVPYKGSTPGLISVASGETQLMITGWINSLPMTKSGKVRPLATVSAKRSPVAPELPALGEVASGYDAEQWYGVFAPAGTPRSIVTTLNAAIVKDLQTPETRSWLSQKGAEAVGSTPEQFSGRIKAEVAKWTRIVQETGTKPQ
jgi:tripartite-type tricarboxylate transporter receptor subunit TctC